MVEGVSLLGWVFVVEVGWVGAGVMRRDWERVSFGCERVKG